MPKARKEFLYGLLFLLPALTILFIFKVLPILFAFNISFHEWGIAGDKGFVGLQNYKFLLQDRYFWQALWNTFLYTLFSVPLSITMALLIAYLLNQNIKGVGLFRTVFFLPVITSLVAVSVVWKWLYNPQRGLFNSILSLLRLPTLKWLEEPRGIFELLTGKDLPYLLEGPSLALFSLVILSVWKSLGYNIVIFIAGLKNISETYYEAAKIDGASRWQIIRHIMLPLLSPTTFYVFIMTTISSFQVFAPVWMMTGPPTGGPLGKTSVVVYYLFRKGYEEYQVGYGSAIAFVFFVIILAITIIQRKLSEKRVYYEV
uniref:Sugar ABC transporter permease n=1 Tax=candidate division WOR-3 bacterium TaxID=2052148 RepID=A0A7C2P076_UNCW3